ncbi:hypothetical protein ACHAQA_002348 [Verticillium albo-atrum]
MASERVASAVVDPALRSPPTSGPATATSTATETPSDRITETAAAAAAAALSAAYHAPHSQDQSPASPHDHDHESHDHDHEGAQHPDEAKRPRACEACRGLKVRCVPDAADPDGPCARCRKARRGCVVTVPTRKRAKKTDSRVAELEKKIDALTASLHARTGDIGDDATAAAAARREVAAVEAERLYTPRAERGAGVKRKLGDRDGEREREREQETRPPPPIRMDSSYDDVVDRGILSMDKAAELFARYNDKMVGHLPAVVFPAGMTVDTLRSTKPVLFLAMLAAASSETSALQRQLVREVMQIFAEKIIITGEKSLELVQALQITVIWYWPPEHFEELKFYQLVHIASVMALDIGLGRKSAMPRGATPYGVYAYRQSQYRRSPPPDPKTVEARRAWLGCYFLASNTAMALHRPLLIRWTKFMADSMEVLRTSPDAAPTDKYFCALVDTHRVSEDVGAQFATAEPEDSVSIREPSVVFSLRGLKRDLDGSFNALPLDLLQPSLIISYHVVAIYMHETVLNVNPLPSNKSTHPAELTLQDMAATSALSGLSPVHINAYSVCLASIHSIFDTYLGTDIPTIRCLPVFNFVRVSYALVVLIKIYFCAVAPGSELGPVMGRDDMKVDTYLTRLLEHFRAAAADDGSRPASKFLVVLVMLRSWFYKQERELGITPEQPQPQPSKDSSSGPDGDEAKRYAPDGQVYEQQSQQIGHLAANTPLHLLSEIATNDRNRVASTNSTATPLSTGNGSMSWPLPRPQPYLYDPASASAPPPFPSQDYTGQTAGNDLTFEELAYSLGFVDSLSFPNQAWGPSNGSGGGAGPGPGVATADDPSGEAGMRYAIAMDPWVGQFGDVLDGMRTGGGGGGGSAWAGPAQPFQM